MAFVMNGFRAVTSVLRYGAWIQTRKAAVVAILCGFCAEAIAEPITIAALGDSLTQGYGLPAPDGFVPQLEAWLQAKGHDVVVMNAGVSGDTTAGGLSRVDWTLTPDVDAMIVALGGNDLLRGLPPEASRANLDRILKTAAAKGVDVLLVGMQAPGNYGPDYKAAFDGMYPELAADYGVLYEEGFLTGIESALVNPKDMVKFVQSDGLHPNAEGVQIIVDTMGPKVAELAQRAGGS